MAESLLEKMKAAQEAANQKRAEMESKQKAEQEQAALEAAKSVKEGKRSELSEQQGRVAADVVKAEIAAAEAVDVVTQAELFAADQGELVADEVKELLANAKAEATEAKAIVEAFRGEMEKIKAELAPLLKESDQGVDEAKAEAVEAKPSPGDQLIADRNAFSAAMDKIFPEQQGPAEATPEGITSAGEALKAERAKVMESVGAVVADAIKNIDTIPGSQARDIFMNTIRTLNAASGPENRPDALSQAVVAEGLDKFSPEESKKVLELVASLGKLLNKRRAETGDAYADDQAELYALDGLAAGALEKMSKEDLQAIRDKVAKGFDQNKNRAPYGMTGAGTSGYFKKQNAVNSDSFLENFDQLILKKAA